MENYSGFRIFNDIIIVEKQNDGTAHQGYIVNPNDKKMLESALNWAKTTIYPVDENGKKDWHNGTVLDGVIHNYKNGTFTLSVCSAAGGSMQGGKLSFWNCKIKAEDGNEFVIGINSDFFCNLLKHNNFNMGECQSKVWLGRQSGNVGAFTENMDEFAQAREDDSIREKLKKKTTKYNPGDEVVSLTESDVYMGEYAFPIKVYQPDFFRARDREYRSTLYIEVPNKLVKEYYYKSSNAYVPEKFTSTWYMRPFAKPNKISRSLSGNRFEVASMPEEIVKYIDLLISEKEKEIIDIETKNENVAVYTRDRLQDTKNSKNNLNCIKKIINYAANSNCSQEDLYNWIAENIVFEGYNKVIITKELTSETKEKLNEIYPFYM